METIIKLAIEGGYGKDLPSFWSDSDRLQYLEFRALLDPLFWQALGKSLGWEEYKSGESFYIPERQWNYPRWKKQWHFFIDHRASGKDIESFFKDLLAHREE